MRAHYRRIGAQHLELLQIERGYYRTTWKGQTYKAIRNEGLWHLKGPDDNLIGTELTLDMCICRMAGVSRAELKNAKI